MLTGQPIRVVHTSPLSSAKRMEQEASEDFALCLFLERSRFLAAGRGYGLAKSSITDEFVSIVTRGALARVRFAPVMHLLVRMS